MEPFHLVTGHMSKFTHSLTGLLVALAVTSTAAQAAGTSDTWRSGGLPPIVSSVVHALLLGLIAILIAYGIRHYLFALNRVFKPQRRTFEGLQAAQWPNLVVFIAAHNEEAVVAHCIEALVNSDYDPNRLTIVPVNDRSTDNTQAICDEWASRYPKLVKPFHRTEGRGGKPAALKDATALYPDAEVYVIFDADYIPSKGLLKQIVGPFLDPEVGVTMGRVVPGNVGTNLLTRMLDMERSAGYQGDQQARQNLAAMPQFGGTVGGIRARALHAVGGFRPDVLAEDTDLTFRLLDLGWKVHYVNTAECQEEVPETWSVRMRQLNRWAKGHNQVMFKHLWRSFFNPYLTMAQRLDSIMLLAFYIVAPLTVLGWILILLDYLSQPGWLYWVLGSSLALVIYGGFGNSAAFFQMAVAVRLDGNARRLRMLPLNFIGYVISAVTITRASVSLLADVIRKRELVWDKTQRFRRTEHLDGTAVQANASKETP